MSRASQKKPITVTIPVRMPEDLQQRIKGLTKKTRSSDADVMRQALDRGLGVMEKMFDEPKSVAA
jgi:predicted DNA-binding protein